MAGSHKQKKDTQETVLATNRAASHEYHLLKKLEAGMVLTGAEVKAARLRRVSLKDGYARIRHGEAYLHGVHFSPYDHSRPEEFDSLRPRKLLLHAREIRKLEKETRSGGMTLVPTRLYLKLGRVKVEIALARGKKPHDKRERERRRELEKEMERADRRR